eukprot:TRINITY_DN25589_c0_g1_i2.p1 TRINITY_DN25589_c0_g1~~TRINITY_DN25589_c0_g1_i2.p1  ORF type:complete len:182 (-),score=21.14 TRINITY_DN25589_c0_g1_i2:169-714(-)
MDGAVPYYADGDALAASADVHMYGLLRWLKQEDFVMAVSEWSWDTCMDFPRCVTSASRLEHSISWTTAHEYYRALFEARAQEYLVRHGVALDNFILLAVDFLDRHPHAWGAGEVLEGLVASENYVTFFNYMCLVRRRREWAEKTLCGSFDEIDWKLLVRHRCGRVFESTRGILAESAGGSE